MTQQIDTTIRQHEDRVWDDLASREPLDKTLWFTEINRSENAEADGGRLFRFNTVNGKVHPGLARIKKGKHVAPHHYLSPKKYRELMDRSGGKCAICGVSAPTTGRNGLHIDHCHRTGYIREALCSRCNKALGYVEDLGWLEKALKYLNYHGSLTPRNDVDK